jgi:GTP pyrophosphokinase
MTTSPEAVLQSVKKKISTLRSRLLGLAQADSQWYVTVSALEFAIKAHDGMFRNNGITPYIVHPVEAAMYVLTLSRSLMYPAQTVAAVLLHDVLEDCDVSEAELTRRFGEQIAGAIQRMSKVVGGVKKPPQLYFADMEGCPIASIGKIGDRVNNHGTMEGVFSPDKQLRQVQETEEFILPMAKAARRNFPQQELAYENGKLVLHTQISLVRAMHKPVTA